MRRVVFSWIVIVLLLLGLSACGYHLEGYRPDGAPRERLYIGLFTNMTSRAFVNDELTSRVVERFARSGLFEIVESPQQADLILDGVLQQYVSAALAYNLNDEISVYRVTLTVQTTLRRTGEASRVIWKGSFPGTQDFSAHSDRAWQQANERTAVSYLCERLADDIYARGVEEAQLNPLLGVP